MVFSLFRKDLCYQQLYKEHFLALALYNATDSIRELDAYYQGKTDNAHLLHNSGQLR
jgi:hypothetical protein